VSRIILHIGTHKTGTTSFQRWFNENESAISSACGATIYKGRFRDARELGAICIDEGRETPAMHRRNDRGDTAAPGAMPIRGSAQWSSMVSDVRESVAEQLRVATDTFVVSSEALCLLRFRPEIDRLAEMFPPEHTTVVVCLRKPADFLRSWRRHLDRDFFEFSDDPTSFAYVKPDSWLVDYEQLLTAYRDVYGNDSVVVVNYDESMATHGSTVAGIAHTFCSDLSVLPSWNSYILNTAGNYPRKPIRGISRPHHYRRYYLWIVAQWGRHIKNAVKKRVVRRPHSE
jgi:hypothetical protein